jgi:hypothetical protein
VDFPKVDHPGLLVVQISNRVDSLSIRVDPEGEEDSEVLNSVEEGTLVRMDNKVTRTRSLPSLRPSLHHPYLRSRLKSKSASMASTA